MNENPAALRSRPGQHKRCQAHVAARWPGALSPLALVLALAFLLAAATALGAEDATEAEAEADEVITVVATRTERSLDEVAATVSVKTAEDIERELARDIADLVRFEPGVTVGGTGSRFGLTGFNIRGIGGNRVLTLIDGIRVPDEFSFGPFLSARRDFVDVDSLARAEIARGPISSLYGSDALGGVVALTSLTPGDRLGERPVGASFKGGYSSADDSLAGTVTAAGQADNLAASVLYTNRTGTETANAASAGGIGAGREEPDPQQTEVDNLNAKVAFTPSDAHQFILGFDRFTSDARSRILSDYGSVVFGTTVNSRDADDTRSRKRWSLNYRHTADLAIADRVSATVYSQRSETHQRTDERRTTRARMAQTRVRLSTFDQKVSGGWIQLGRAFSFAGTDHLVTYGGETTLTKNASMRDGGTFDAGGSPMREFSPLPTRDFPLTDTTQFALFVQDEIALAGGRLTLSPGLRFDSFDAEASPDAIYLSGNPGSPTPADYNDAQATAKVGAVYAFSDAVSAWARYSQGFRAPPYDDVNVGFSNFLGGYKTVANPNLESERSGGFEAGLRLGIDGVSAEIAAFRNDYENFIESFALAPAFLASGGIDPADGLRTFQSVNREEVVIQGLELRGSVELGLGFAARVALAYADGEDKQRDEPLDSVEPLTGVVGLAYAGSNGRWGTELIWSLAQGKDPSDVDSTSMRPTPGGYGVVDLLTHFDIGTRSRLHAGLFNIGDKTYIRWNDTASIGADAAARFTQPGFNAAVTFRLDL